MVYCPDHKQGSVIGYTFLINLATEKNSKYTIWRTNGEEKGNLYLILIVFVS